MLEGSLGNIVPGFDHGYFAEQLQTLAMSYMNLGDWYLKWSRRKGRETNVFVKIKAFAECHIGTVAAIFLLIFVSF